MRRSRASVISSGSDMRPVRATDSSVLLNSGNADSSSPSNLLFVICKKRSRPNWRKVEKRLGPGISIASQLCTAHHSSSARLHERLTQASLQNWVHVSHLRRPVIRATTSVARENSISARCFWKLAGSPRPSSSGSSMMQLGSDQEDRTRDAALAAAISSLVAPN